MTDKYRWATAKDFQNARNPSDTAIQETYGVKNVVQSGFDFPRWLHPDRNPEIFLPLGDPENTPGPVDLIDGNGGYWNDSITRGENGPYGLPYTYFGGGRAPVTSYFAEESDKWDEWTIFAWIRTNGDAYIASMDADEYWRFFINGGDLELRWRTSDGTQTDRNTGAYVADGDWHFVSASYNSDLGGRATMTYYVDGEVVYKDEGGPSTGSGIGTGTKRFLMLNGNSEATYYEESGGRSGDIDIAHFGMTASWTTDKEMKEMYDSYSNSKYVSLKKSLVQNDRVSFQTATDWSKTVDEIRLQSESAGDRISSTLQLGYPNNGEGLVAYYPLDEDVGLNANDVFNGYDLNNNGVTNGSTGVLGTSGYINDGSGILSRSDSSPFETDEFTWIFTINPQWSSGSLGYDPGLCGIRDTNNTRISFHIRDDYSDFFAYNGSQTLNFNNNTLSQGQWKTIGVTHDGNGNIRYFENGEAEEQNGFNAPSGTGYGFKLGGAGSGFEKFDGRMDEFRWYNRELNDREMYYEYLRLRNGRLRTQSKTFGKPVKPDVQNLDYQPNGETLTLHVVGSPNVVDYERHKIPLDGSQDYSLDWDNSHTTFAIDVSMSSKTITASPQLRQIDLVV